MPRKKQGLRSYHKKSRYGCMQCKRRRVKCNMQSPTCGNCVRRNEICEYPTISESNNFPPLQWPMELAEDWSTSVAQASPFSTIPISETLESNLSVEDTRSLLSGLLRHSSWFSPAETALWVPTLSNLSIKFPYLQHCILAVCKLRRNSADPPFGSTPATAYQHQVAASSLFRQSPPTITEENWMAVLSFGVFMLIFQFYSQRTCPKEQFDLIETLRVVRGTMAIENTCNTYLRRTQFWALIMARTTIQNLQPDVRMRNSLQTLAIVVSNALEHEDNDDDEEERAELNRQAFWELREWAIQCEGYPRRWDQYCFWPSQVLPEFLELLGDNDDIALLIFIYWAVILQRSPKFVIKAWARRAALFAVERLQEDWSELLIWPLEEMSTILRPGHPSSRETPIHSELLGNSHQYPTTTANADLELYSASTTTGNTAHAYNAANHMRTE